jgi:hypothetical protein
LVIWPNSRVHIHHRAGIRLGLRRAYPSYHMRFSGAYYVPQTAQLRAKHGVILSCALHAPTGPPSAAHALERLGASAKGERYGSWPPLSDGAEIGKVTRWLAGMLN